MHYLTDNPLPPIMLLATIAVVAFMTGTGKGRMVAGACVLLSVGLFFLERYLISPGEEVEAEMATMLQNFQDADLNAISAQIADESQSLRDIAKGGLDLVDITEDFHLKSVDVTIDDTGKNATAMVRANGNVVLKKHGGAGQHVPTFWKTEWQQQNSAWKLKTVTRLNPGNGQEMGYYSAN